ncbi:putative TIR domain-containing protein [Helianthus annuus]|nr:putative TIR domain-containing protein [Helianthus annuus]
MACTSSSASSTNPTPTIIRFDLFLSFRGEDTRHNFTDHLYHALLGAGLCTFRDNDEIDRGQQLKPEIQTAIIESRAYIVVLSQNYANSIWCLDELCLILECIHQMSGTKEEVLFVFWPEALLATYVCVAQTRADLWILQLVCFLAELSLKKVCETSSPRRHQPMSSILFSPLINTPFHMTTYPSFSPSRPLSANTTKTFPLSTLCPSLSDGGPPTNSGGGRRSPVIHNHPQQTYISGGGGMVVSSALPVGV